jgi:hypothetical protein
MSGMAPELKGPLGFLHYNRLREGNKEFTRSDLWDISFTSRPKCYFPGQQFINQRCTAVSPGIPNSVGNISHNIRGFEIHQATNQTTAGSATLTFVDREDLAIRTWIEEWKQLMSHRDTLKGARKSDYCCEIKINYYNTSRKLISSLILYNCMLTDASPAEDGTNEPSSTSDISLTLRYEHFTREYYTRGAGSKD